MEMGKPTMNTPYSLPRHGHARRDQKTSVYRTWKSMLERCRNTKQVAFARYGGRGISVCERWIVFENFLADMGEKPAGTSLDRIANNGNYEPGNCRWATRNQQARNKSNTAYFTINGITKPVIDWAEDFCLKANTLKKRIANNVPLEQLFCQPATRRQTNRATSGTASVDSAAG